MNSQKISPINLSESMENIEEEIEDLNLSYSDTSSDGGGLSSPPLGMIKVQRRRLYVKGQGWTSIVVNSEPKVDEIRELIGKFKTNKKNIHSLYQEVIKGNH